jgi:hypothetical protein
MLVSRVSVCFHAHGDIAMVTKKAELHAVPENPNKDITPIAKPASGFSLDKFKSKRDDTIASVETKLGPLPHHKIADANDFVRLHPDEENYWSDELCFVSVPIKGQKGETLHFITEELAELYLPSKKILRFRLALGIKGTEALFLCHIPSRNLDNSFNSTALSGCEDAKTLWVMVTSRKDKGYDDYQITRAVDQDSFVPPKWPSQSLSELIEATFTGRMIEEENHPAMRRLRGAKQSLS